MTQYGYDQVAYDAAFSALKTEVQPYLPNLPFYDDKYIARFLRARKLDVPKAKAMLMLNITWRQNFNVDGVLDRPPPSDQFVKTLPHGFIGHAKDGCPIYVERTGLGQMHLLLPKVAQDQVLHWKVWTQEYLQKLIRDAGKEQCYAIMDMKGLSFRHASKAVLDFYKFCGAIDEANYPEELSKVFVINSSLVFTTIWRAAKYFFAEDIRAKVNILGGDYETEMYKWIDRDQLPPFLKGTRQNVPAWCSETLTGQLTDGMTEVKVAPGKSFDYTVEAQFGGETIAWEFHIDKHSLLFSVRSPTGTLQAEEKMDSASSPFSNSATAQGRGTYTLSWRNDSMTQTKTLFYKAFVVTDSGMCPTSPATFDF